MSATNRGAKRHAQDFYATPLYGVHRLLDRWWPWPDRYSARKFRIYDPCAGDGAIFRAIMSHPRWPEVASRTEFLVNELRRSSRPALERLRAQGAPIQQITYGDFLSLPAPREKVDLILTNPPFCLAQEFVARSREIATWASFLLRVNFFGSQRRQEWFQTGMPARTLVLPDRPAFAVNDDGQVATDSTEYAWMNWNRERRSAGTIEVLGPTPAAVISAARREIREAHRRQLRRRA